MKLVTNKAARDAELARRVAAIGGCLTEVDDYPWGSGPRSYSLYATFPGDAPEGEEYRHGARRTVRGYHLTVTGFDKLDALTANPDRFGGEYRAIRYRCHAARLDLQRHARELANAERAHGRAATEAFLVDLRRGTRAAASDDQEARATQELTSAMLRLREAVRAHDGAEAAIVAIVGEARPLPAVLYGAERWALG